MIPLMTLVFTPAFAQYMGNADSQDETDQYALEAPDIQKRIADTASKYEIPSWIKGVAGFWAEGKISDADFIEGLSFLINSGIIKVPIIQELENRIIQLENENRQLRNSVGSVSTPTSIESQNSREKLDEIEKINLENEYLPKEREWITSGAFQIDQSQYAIGEKIFLVVEGLNANEKGQIAVMRPLNATHYSAYLTIPFDGSVKPSFNYYIEPQISKVRGICSVDDMIGEWAIVFRGTDYPNLNFEITKDIVSGTNIEPVC